MTLAQDLGKIGDALGGDRPLAGFRNAIINGNFDIWQRGTSFTNPAIGAYTADRWLIGSDSSGATRNISRQTFAIGQTDVPGEPVYFYRFNQSVAGSGGTYNNIEQRIESVRTFAGQTITISFYAKAASSLTMPSVFIGQVFGTGGSPSATVYTAFATSLAVGTTWAKYTVTGTVPSITGKTLGSNNDDYLVLILQLPTNTTFTFDIAQVQLEAGPVATPFERRPIGTELALCQRYYEKSYNIDVTPGTANSNPGRQLIFMHGFPSSAGLLGGSTVYYATKKRTAATVTTYSYDTGAAGKIRDTGTGADITPAIFGQGQSSFALYATVATTSIQVNFQFHWAADAEL